MGSFIETNDTLQITTEQWFPEILNLETHLHTPYQAKDFEWKIFEFHNKPKIRIYHAPPVRNFLVENRAGKWIYWGLIHVLEENHDMEHLTTSWKYKILYIYTPEEMKIAHKLIDRNPETDYFWIM